jgi:hypothetical protein
LAGAHLDDRDGARLVFEWALVFTEPAVVELADAVVDFGGRAEWLAEGVVRPSDTLLDAGVVGGDDDVAVGVRVRPHRRSAAPRVQGSTR